IAFFLADVLRQTLRTNQPEPELYTFLVEKINDLNTERQLAHFPLRFLADYTEHIGIAPHMESDARYFSLAEGEFHSDLRPGELGIEGTRCTELYRLFNGEEE